MPDTTGRRGPTAGPDITGERRSTGGPDSTGEPGTTAGPDITGEPGATAGAGTPDRPETTAEPGTTVGAGAGTPARPGSTPEPGVTPKAGAAAEAPSAVTPAGAAGPLLAAGESDRLGERLHHAVTGFVDAPRVSVEEADRVLEEIAARFTDAVAHRRRTLRSSWQEAGPDGGAPSTDTEQLRLALRDYRELADRLMRL
ncbi:hypothetical protein PEM37_14560 [Streptomyces sp. AD681]|uniref:hypothetical protein n=1 Tax=Streptomyces sp. AD681 TaxID=3019069 RepID=UPI0022F1DA46|nr:hypothetical protein [Streptomyces sp. AD681]MDA5142736.1 hypothetical protein [Streptomyces sp. AD681]